MTAWKRSQNKTKLTMGNAIVKLVKKVKKLEGFLKRRNVVLSDSKEEEPEARGRKSQDDPLASLVFTRIVTPSMTKVNASGEDTRGRHKLLILFEAAKLFQGCPLLSQKGTWKLSQLKNLSFEEVKEEFDKLVKQMIESKGLLKPARSWKEEEGENRWQKKGIAYRLNKDNSEGSDEVSEQDDSVSGTKILINPVPVAMKSPSIATYKIIKQGEKGVYQIVREDGTDIVYINFGAMLKDISRDDLTAVVLRIVHCLNLESMDIYMLIERKYPLSAEICKAMLDKKLQGGKPDENCYKMLKMMEKQAGIRK
ncbi:hypothetical protein Tco_1081908 [Tanacetum coccineum]|uniref:Uncharacterized protein n=1 Tax=Tanacetum coccineum TaxID=301880 RepID=A0ABQ5HYZ9_9ASTR